MNIKNDILGLQIKQSNPRQGDILISEPFLVESFFERAAISLIEHRDGSPSMGLVLNHVTPYYLDEAIEGIEINKKIPLYCGGPLSSDRLFYIHTLGSIIPDSQEIVKGLYINGDLRIIKSYINAGEPIENTIRFFLGYSGWDNGQLSEELNQHVWGVLKPDTSNLGKYLKSDGNQYWKSRVREMGDPYKPWLLCPLMPILN